MAPKKSKIPVYLIDTQNPFYRPLWLRATICGFAVFWAILETVSKQPFWAVIAIATAAYCIYVLFVAYAPPEDTVGAAPRPDDPQEEEDAPGEDNRSN